MSLKIVRLNRIKKELKYAQSLELELTESAQISFIEQEMNTYFTAISPPED